MKIPRAFFAWAIRHIVQCGDTDIFPYPFELNFLSDKLDGLSDDFSQQDIRQFHPLSLIEALIPKSKFGFRVAHQIYPTDLVFFTGIVFAAAERIENSREPPANMRAFSYRVSPAHTNEFFDPDRRFKNWLDYLGGTLAFSKKYSHVISTDISDFYARVYRHRLENILETMIGDRIHAKAIESVLRDWRSRQSFGIPVGSSAARLLAEVALSDTDLALASEGLDSTRYVDDFVVLIPIGRDPYAALAFLANHLAISEGLSLNNQKTIILPWGDFVQQDDLGESGEDDAAAEESALERLYWAAYGEDETDPEALEKLTLLDLQKELEEALEEPLWNMGKVRVILRAMRLTKSARAAEYVRDNIPRLVPFAKDVVLLIEEFLSAGDKTFSAISGPMADLILSPID